MPGGYDPLFKSAADDGHSPIPVGTFVFSGTAVFSPVMVLKQSALAHNLAEMAAYCQMEGIQLAPHGKTTMSPELVMAQIDAGAWGVSAAVVSQVRAFWEFGAHNVVLANELVDPAGIRWIAQHLQAHPDHRFLCWVDSLRGVEVLNRTLHELHLSVTVSVLVEISAPGGRTGCRTTQEALAVAQAVDRAAWLTLRGVAGYEGALVADRSVESTERVAAYCRHVVHVAQEIDRRELFDGDADVILSVGGGAFFDIVVDVLRQADLPRSRTTILIRAGSYISHDNGLYERIAAFAQPTSSRSLHAALEIWGRVLSRPEPTKAFLDFGRRDVSFDQGLPVPLHVRNFEGSAPRTAAGMTITTLNDQHAYLDVDAEDPLAPGEWVGCGISHPCTAFDKWRYIPVVDADYCVVAGVTTYF